LNQGIHTSEYNERFHEIMMADACEIMEEQEVKSIEDCKAFSKGVNSEVQSIRVN